MQHRNSRNKNLESIDEGSRQSLNSASTVILEDCLCESAPVMVVKPVVVFNLLARKLPHRPDDLDVRIGGIAETDVTRDLHPPPRRDPRQEVDRERGRAFRREQLAEPILLRYPHQELPLQVPRHGLLRRTILHPGEQLLEPAPLFITRQVTVRCIFV